MVRKHTEVAKKFYGSNAWRKTRKAYINSLDNGGMCEQCIKYNEYNHGYIVDHIIEINIDNINNPDITLSWDNLQYLCLSCHNKKTFGNPENLDAIPNGCAFDEFGNLIQKK